MLLFSARECVLTFISRLWMENSLRNLGHGSGMAIVQKREGQKHRALAQWQAKLGYHLVLIFQALPRKENMQVSRK